MSRALHNWILSGSDQDDEQLRKERSRGRTEYTPGEWTDVLLGLAFVSTIVVSNNKEYKDHSDGSQIQGSLIKLRVVDKDGRELVVIEPGTFIRDGESDYFRNDSIPIMEGQRLQFYTEETDVQLFVSGTNYRRG